MGGRDAVGVRRTDHPPAARDRRPPDLDPRVCSRPPAWADPAGQGQAGEAGAVAGGRPVVVGAAGGGESAFSAALSVLLWCTRAQNVGAAGGRVYAASKPDMAAELKKIAGTSATAVLVCGPGALQQAVTEACVDNGWHLHAETFFL